MHSNSVGPAKEFLEGFNMESRAHVLNPKYSTPTSLPLYFYFVYQLLQEFNDLENCGPVSWNAFFKILVQIVSYNFNITQMFSIQWFLFFIPMQWFNSNIHRNKGKWILMVNFIMHRQPLDFFFLSRIDYSPNMKTTCIKSYRSALCLVIENSEIVTNIEKKYKFIKYRAI